METNRSINLSSVLAVVGFALVFALCLGLIFILPHWLNDEATSKATSWSMGYSSTRSDTGTDSYAISSTPWDMWAVYRAQHDKVQELIQERDYDAALVEAKSFYNVAALVKTKDAMKLVAKALGRARGAATAGEFAKEQTSITVPCPISTDEKHGSKLLQDIWVDPSTYDKTISQLLNRTDDIDSILGCANLSLLADRPHEAQEYFEYALQLAVRGKNGKSGRESRALEGIARAIRDEDGSAIRADAFILSMKEESIFVKNVPGETVMARAHSAAAALSPSGIFANNVVLNSYESPEDPSVKALADTELVTWLEKWQRNSNPKLSKDDRIELQSFLKRTPLSCLALIGIGRAISLQSTDDWTPAAFYAAAASRADKELAHPSAGDRQALAILVGLNSAKITLWKVVDGGDRSFVDSFFALNSDLIHWIPDTNASLRDAKAHGYVGAAECLWVMGQNAEALAAAQSINTSSMDDEEKRAVAWIRGLALYTNGLFAPAADQFRIVTMDPEFKYTENAWCLLAISLARSQKLDEADTAVQEWIRRYHPPAEKAARLLGQVGIINRAVKTSKYE
jgi:hypothetical protein